MNEFDTTTGLVERARAITLNPDQTWPRIAAEQTSPGDLITRYAMPLIAIGPIAGFIGGQVFGIGMVFATYRPSLIGGLGMAITGFVTGLFSLVVIALITDALAPRFGGQASRTQAFKLVAYSLTPGWVAAVLGIVPALAVVGLLAAFYGLYLFYKGTPVLMKVPQDRAGGFTAVTVIGAILVNWIAAMLLTSATGLFGMGAGLAAMTNRAEDRVEVNLPGAGTIDSAKMEQAARQLDILTQGKGPKPVDIAALQALLPANIGAYQRSAVESGGVGGLGSRAEATYRAGDKQIRVEIVDIAALGAVAGALGGLGIEQNREDADGYERTRTVDGVIQTEKWDNKRGRGSFGTQVAGRFMVQAEGEVGSIDELKRIVGGIDQARLAALVK